MEFSIEKCVMLIMKRMKKTDSGSNRPEKKTQVSIRKVVKKENYKYVGILEADTIKQAEMKEKIKTE